MRVPDSTPDNPCWGDLSPRPSRSENSESFPRISQSREGAHHHAGGPPARGVKERSEVLPAGGRHLWRCQDELLNTKLGGQTPDEPR